MAAPNIIELRQLLAGKFPGLRTRADEIEVRSRLCWSTGLPSLDYRLGGGFAKAAITEVVAPHRGSGAASFAAHLLAHAAGSGQLAGLVDGGDSFDPGGVHPDVLARLLWVRCRSGEEALKGTDLLLRDGNLPVVVVDLTAVVEAQPVPAPAWYRFQRIIEERGVTGIFFTPRPMIAPAQARVTLGASLDWAALDAERADILASLRFVVHESRQASRQELMRQTA